MRPARRSLEAWPFAVARNRSLDWRPIVAPDFLVRADRQYVLLRGMTLDSADGTAVWSAPARVVDDAELGAMTVVSRARVMTRAELGGDGRTPLVDSSGREVSVVEGFVVRGRHPDLAAQVSGPGPARTASTNEYFRAFWPITDEAWQAAGTESFALPVLDTGSTQQLPGTVPPAGAQPTGRRPRAGTAAGALVLLVIATALGRRGRRTVLDRRVRSGRGVSPA